MRRAWNAAGESRETHQELNMLDLGRRIADPTVRTFVHIHMYMYIHMYMSTAYKHMRAYVRIRKHICTYTYATCAYICTYTYVYGHMYMSTAYVYVHIYICTYAHINLHVCSMLERIGAHDVRLSPSLFRYSLRSFSEARHYTNINYLCA